MSAVPEARPLWWSAEERPSEERLAELRLANNPAGAPTGHFTGRCAACGSGDLWTDATAYGCNCCQAIYPTGEIPPRKIENATGRDLGPAW